MVYRRELFRRQLSTCTSLRLFIYSDAASVVHMCMLYVHACIRVKLGEILIAGGTAARQVETRSQDPVDAWTFWRLLHPFYNCIDSSD